MYIVREDASQYFGTMWIKWRLKCVVQQEKHSNVSCEHVISPSKEQQLLLRDDGIWTFFESHCDSDSKFLRNAPEKIRAEKKTAMSLSTDEQMFRIDHQLTILLFMVIQIYYSQQYQSAETSKKSSILTMDCLIDLLACFYSVFLAILHEDAVNYAKCSFYLFQALVFHSMCYVPFAMHAFYWYETFYTSRIIILFRKIKCICLMALATKSWKFGYFDAFCGTSKANRSL